FPSTRGASSTLAAFFTAFTGRRAPHASHSSIAMRPSFTSRVSGRPHSWHRTYASTYDLTRSSICWPVTLLLNTTRRPSSAPAVPRPRRRHVSTQFEDFHPPSPVRSADVSKARIFEFRDVRRVDLVPMPVSLENRRGPVQFCGLRVRVHVDLVGPEAHRRAHPLHAPLLREQVDDGMRRLRIELGTVRALQAEVVACETNRRELEPEAHPLER